MRHLLARLAAAALVVAAAVAVPAGPASASYCSGGGVNVLVDASALGAGSQLECGPGPKASTAFKDDFTLTGYPGDPAYVCQIDGLPADGDCRQTDAYWALFVSDDGGAWSYATTGAYNLAVDDGDSVAFVWQDSASRRAPGTAPAPSPSATPTQPGSSPTRQPTEQPTEQPTRKPTKQPAGQPSTDPATPATSAGQPSSAPSSATSSAPTTTATTATPSASPTGSGQPGRRKGHRATETKVTHLTSLPTASPTATAEPTLTPAAQQGPEDEGLPAWLALVALALVGIAAGAVVLRRRRAGDGP